MGSWGGPLNLNRTGIESKIKVIFFVAKVMYENGTAYARVHLWRNSKLRMEQLSLSNGAETRADWDWWGNGLVFNENSGKGCGKYWGCELISNILGVY